MLFKFLKCKSVSMVLDVFLVFLSAFLIYFSFLFSGVLIWIAFIPLMLVAHKNNFRKFILPALVYSMAMGYLQTHWVIIWASGISYIFVVLGFLYVVLCHLFFALSLNILFKKVDYPYQIFIAPFLWFVIVTFSVFVPIGPIWFNFAALQPILFPLTFLLGEKGMIFLILLMNSLLAFFLIKKDRKLLYVWLVITTILMFCYVYSWYALPSGTKIKVALIQGNFPLDWDWRVAHSDTEIINTYIRLSLEAAKEKPDVIVWPEYAIPADISVDTELNEKIRNAAREANAILVLGSMGTTEKTDPEYNYTKDMANIFSSDGEHIGNYVSVVPFPFENKVIKGDILPVFDTAIGKFGVSTCYEEYFGYIFKNYAQSGAQFFISISNDNPIKTSWVVKYKSKVAQFRASESGKYLVRANNTGITEIINPYGKVVAQLEQNKSGYLLADIYIK